MQIHGRAKKVWQEHFGLSKKKWWGREINWDLFGSTVPPQRMQSWQLMTKGFAWDFHNQTKCPSWWFGSTKPHTQDAIVTSESVDADPTTLRMWDVHPLFFGGAAARDQPKRNTWICIKFFFFFFGGGGWLSTKKHNNICARSGMVYQLGSTTYRL